MSSLFSPFHMLLFMLSCQINIRNNFYFPKTRRDLRIRGVSRKEELCTQSFRRRAVIYGYGACRGKNSCLPSTFQRYPVIYRYEVCREKIDIFFKINRIYLIKKKEIQLYQCKINSKLPSSLFSNYINFKIIYFLNQK